MEDIQGSWESWQSSNRTVILVGGTTLTILATILIYFRILHRTEEDGSGRKRKIPPGPYYYPIVGNLPSMMTGDCICKSLAELSWKKKWSMYTLKLIGRKGPSAYILCTPELAMEMLKTSGSQFASRNTSHNFAFKLLAYDDEGIPRGISGNPVTGNWRTSRRVMVNGLIQARKVFGDSLLNKELEVLFEEVEADGHADGLFVHLLLSPIARFLANNIAHFVYGHWGDRTLGAQIVSMNDTIALCLTKGQICGFFPVLEFLWKYKYTNIMKDTLKQKYQLHDDLLAKRERLRETEGASSWYFCDTCLEAEKAGEISRVDTLHILDEAFLAGVMTTASTVEWGLGELVNRQDIIKRLQKEMDTIVGVGVPIRANDIDRLPYLKATIKEVLRCHPAVPLLVPHVNPEDAKLGGYDIPKQSLTLVNVWQLGRDPESWDKPHLFNPDRFLEHPEVDVWGLDNRLLPFGAGRRVCPGIAVGLLNTQMIIGRMVQRYHITPPPGLTQIDLTPTNGSSIHIKNGLRVCLKRRL